MRRKRLVIAGSRGIKNQETMIAAVEEAAEELDLIIDETMVISGGAPGVDQLAEEWARKKQIPFYVIPAEWGKHGKSAGYVRNAEMARVGDVLLAVWDGQSRGTLNMIEAMDTIDKPVFVCTVDAHGVITT